MTTSVADWIPGALIALNSLAAVGALVSAYREHAAHVRTWNRLAAAQREAHAVAAELVALRKTNGSLLAHIGGLGQRNKLLATELAIGDGTKRTTVWRGRKPEVWQP